MRQAAWLVPLALLVGACGGSTSSSPRKSATPPATRTTAPTPTPHVIKVVYDPPQSKSDAVAEMILKDSGTTGVAQGFSQNFNFPVDLEIHAVHGSGSPFYDPQTKTVTLYYGFVNTTAAILTAGEPGISQRELGTQWAAVNGFILIHELGHAFVDVFQLPITGREEDAVDGMATVFFTDSVKNGVSYAFDAARFFHFLQGVQGKPDAEQFQDEHSLSVQRAYDIVCSVAGSSAQTMRQIGSLGILSPDRLQRCPAEYREKSSAWNTLLKPHLRNAG